MLFLFNDAVFDVGDPETTALNAPDAPADLDLRALKLHHAVALAREAVFEEQHIARNRPEKAQFIAALIAWKSGEANALLAVRPDEAIAAKDVGVRLAAVSLRTVQDLYDLHQAGRLSSHAVNMMVWSQIRRAS